MLHGPLSLLTLSMRRLGAAAILVTVLLAAPSDVEATCGDYLSVPKHNAAHARIATDDELTSESSERTLPCRGPECSRAPQAPLAPVPPVTVETHEQGLLAAMQAGAARDALTSAVCDAAPRPVIFGLPLFRPPR